MTNFAIIIELLYTKTRCINLLTSLVFIALYYLEAIKVFCSYFVCNIYPFFLSDTMEMLVSSSSILRR